MGGYYKECYNNLWQLKAVLCLKSGKVKIMFLHDPKHRALNILDERSMELISAILMIYVELFLPL